MNNDIDTGIDPDVDIDPFEGFVWWMSQIVDASTLQRLINEAIKADAHSHESIFRTFVDIARQAREDMQ
jgi:hypothetical protein